MHHTTHWRRRGHASWACQHRCCAHNRALQLAVPIPPPCRHTCKCRVAPAHLAPGTGLPLPLLALEEHAVCIAAPVLQRQRVAHELVLLHQHEGNAAVCGACSGSGATAWVARQHMQAAVRLSAGCRLHGRGKGADLPHPPRQTVSARPGVSA